MYLLIQMQKIQKGSTVQEVQCNVTKSEAIWYSQKNKIHYRVQFHYMHEENTLKIWLSKDEETIMQI